MTPAAAFVVPLPGRGAVGVGGNAISWCLEKGHSVRCPRALHVNPALCKAPEVAAAVRMVLERAPTALRCFARWPGVNQNIPFVNTKNCVSDWLRNARQIVSDGKVTRLQSRENFQ